MQHTHNGWVYQLKLNMLGFFALCTTIDDFLSPIIGFERIEVMLNRKQSFYVTSNLLQ